MNEPNPLLQGIARALMNPIARDQAQSAVTLGQRVGDVLMAGPRAWGRMMDSGYRTTGQPDDPIRDQMAADAMDVAGSVTVGGMPFAKPGALGSAGGKAGIKAYHGSPHDFDRFDLSKIGTGEGAQAYGHGLYFAESEGVASFYRDNLTPVTVSFRGKNMADDVAKTEIRDTIAQELIARRGSDLTPLERAAIRNAVDDYVNVTPKAQNLRRDFPHDIYDTTQKMLDEGGFNRTQPDGRMYEVRIDADPNDFLDWDKPLSQQSEKVRGLLQHPAVKRQAEFFNDPNGEKLTGKSAYGAVSNWNTAGSQRMGSGDPTPLREAGIPGIKYLDQGSRAAGDGSRNYVLFRDDIISIVRKYGVAAAASMFGMDAVIQAQTAEALQQ